MKLGSLFDGSGGFPLAGSLCGIEPVWAAEVEPYPIAVTKSRFPNMKHLGSVTEINGAEIEPVDVITFGSPCQDLSVAGKRAGLKHEVNGDDETTRSGLFMEAVRIIREMRKATNGRYPNFALWENVPGAFSSNKGEDFRIVLEELIKTVEPYAVMPPVPAKGWPYADCYCGDGWSLAYRVLDAQHWGVPQRRKRIYLVLDLTGERAKSVLFEREGLRGHFAKSGTPWQAAAGDAENCAGAADREGEIAYTYLFRPVAIENHPADSRVNIDNTGTVQTLTSRMGMGGGNVPMILETIPIHDKATRYQGGGPTRNGELNGDLCGTLQAKPNGGFSYNCIHPIIVKTPIRYIVRRLTPTECARLQGFPDDWGHPVHREEITDTEYRFWLEVRKTHAAINGKPIRDYTAEQIMSWYNKLHTESSEYKMWGNGIALPTALYVMQGIAETERITA